MTCRGVWGLKALEAGRSSGAGHALPLHAGREGGTAAAFCGQSLEQSFRSLPEGGRAPRRSPPLLLRIHLELQGWESLEVLSDPKPFQETISKHQ